MVSAIRSIEY